jgi:hypothetical protein
MIQEFGKGVRPSVDENVKLDADAKLRLPVSIVVAGKETIHGVETIKYELRRQERVQLTEFLKVDESGVSALARSAEDGEKSELAPPQKILSFPPRTGEKWNYNGRVGEIETTQAYEIVAKESITVPAVQIRCVSSAPDAVEPDATESGGGSLVCSPLGLCENPHDDDTCRWRSAPTDRSPIN